MVNGESIAQPPPPSRFFPAVEFPSGICHPVIVCTVLALLLAGLTSALQWPREPTISIAHASGYAEQQLAIELARGAGDSLNVAVRDVVSAASGDATPVTLDTSGTGGQPGQLLDRLNETGGWRGVTLLGADRRVLASRGEPPAVSTMPTPAVGEVAVSLSYRPVGDPVVLVLASLSGGGQLLAATRSLRLPELPAAVSADHQVFVRLADGRLGAVQGAPADQLTEADRAVIHGAVGGSGIQVGRAGPSGVPIAAAAPITGDSSRTAALGSVVVFARHPSAVPEPVDNDGLLAGVLLGVITGLGFLAVWLMVIRPLVRLRCDAAAVAGGRPGHRVRQTPSGGTSEVGRIARALVQLRAVQPPESALSESALSESAPSESAPSESARRGRAPARAAPVRRRPVAFLTVLAVSIGFGGWSLVVLALAPGPATNVPEPLIRVLAARTELIAERVSRRLRAGASDALEVAGAVSADPTSPAAATAALRRLPSPERYRSGYVVGPDGHVLATVGRTPLTGSPNRDPGIHLAEPTGPVPVLYTASPTRTGGIAVLEFDMDALTDELRADSRIRLVDAAMRTVADPRGFLAFERLDVAEAMAASAPNPNVLIAPSGTPMLLASAPIGLHPASRGPGLRVVIEHPLASLALPQSEHRRAARLVALLGAGLAALLFCWHEVGVLRPLRRLATAADRLAAGELREPVVPRGLNEIGMIAADLDSCRRAVLADHCAPAAEPELSMAGSPEAR
jgi:HAMP domain-containing protein